jgi:hypothetical protein
MPAYSDATSAAYPLKGRVGRLASSPSRSSRRCDQRGCGTSGFTLPKKPYSDGAACIQVVTGACSTSRMCVMAFGLLKPYFHGTASRSGAPFCGGSALPYRPVATSVSGCMASSMRSASV